MYLKPIINASLLAILSLWINACQNTVEQPPPQPSIVTEQAAPSRQIEGKNAVGLINRSQQAYHLEKQTFGDSTTSLGITIPLTYYGQPTLTAATPLATVILPATQPGLKSYSGGVLYANEQYIQVICETTTPSNSVAPPVASGSSLSCPPGTVATN